ncbi:MAG: VWA domain-containing protein [Chloroflexi bacterium]|nr:VWA domain-containing protein [Chloroflexota bacterium]
MSLTFIYPLAIWLLLLIPLTAGLALLGPRRPTHRRFWFGLVLRAILLALIVLALAGIQIRTPADNLTVVFVMDVSDSVSPEEQARGEDYIRQAVAEMPTGDQAAVIVFGEDALVERLAGETRRLPDLASVPITTRTDIASALQLALALFPNEGAKRLVLLSDGRENLGQAIEQAELAAAHQIELTYLPLGGEAGEAEVLLESLEAPASVRQGQNFELSAVIHSTGPANAELRVFADGQLIHSQEVTLRNGANRVTIPAQAGESGFRRYSAQIVPDNDTRLQNNQASAFTVVHGPPRVLLVVAPAPEAGTDSNGLESSRNPAEALSQALESAQMQVTTLPAGEIPTSLTSLSNYDAVVLVDVPATALPPEAMEALQVYVRDLGRGLLMTGGEQSFGAGGYLRTPLEETLPVYMDVRNKQQEANLALVLAVDKSGSMGRCHCDDPDLNQSYSRQESGQPKVDIAKEAIMRAASALGELDFLGVVAFDNAARWAVETQKLVDPHTLENAIGAIPANGQTNLQAGVEAAFDSLLEVEAQRKHIILLTDGWVHTTSLLAKAREMQEQGITLSVVAAGGGSALYLKELAELGGGTYYPATDILRVPDFFLKETVTAVGRYIIEEPFYPLPGMSSPILINLDPRTLPALYGYNGTTPKGTARLDLITPQGDPLLASWQYGLGRAAAWTSDVESRWATQWLTWEGFPTFAAQLVGWTLPAPQVEGLTASARVEEDRGVIELEAVDENDLPWNFLYAHASLVAPDLSVSEAELSQISPGRYRADVKLSQPGTYLVRLGVNAGDKSLGQQILGLVVPYSPEYRASGVDLPFLGELARLTGGGELPEPVAAFVHNLKATTKAREIWQPLLLAVALLFPLDVAIRRVMLGRSDYLKAAEWVRARLPWGKRIRQRVEETDKRMLGGLFEARERARGRQARGGRGDGGMGRDGEERIGDRELGVRADEQASSLPASQPVENDTLSRLREAKKRAQKDGE